MSGGCPKCLAAEVLTLLRSPVFFADVRELGPLFQDAIDNLEIITNEKLKWCPEHAPSVTGECAIVYGPTEIDVHDVVQLDPELPFGPVLAIVDEVKSWGVQASVLVPTARDTPPNLAPMRVEWGDFARIGRATWSRGT